MYLSYVYPNDFTRLTHMERENKCFYRESPVYLEKYGLPVNRVFITSYYIIFTADFAFMNDIMSDVIMFHLVLRTGLASINT